MKSQLPASVLPAVGPPRHRRRAIAAVTALALGIGVGLAGCGDDDATTTGAETPAKAPAASGELAAGGPQDDQILERVTTYFTSDDVEARCAVLSSSEQSDQGCPSQTDHDPSTEGSDLTIVELDYDEDESTYGAEVQIGGMEGQVGLEEEGDGYVISSLYNFRPLAP